MARGDTAVWLVFNGEIYIFLDLAPILKDKGHEFRSKSDTEVIIHAYEEYGKDYIHQFNGSLPLRLGIKVYFINRLEKFLNLTSILEIVVRV